MTELLKNSYRATAEKHGRAGGDVPPVRITIARSRKHLTMRIRDEGGGISPRACWRVESSLRLADLLARQKTSPRSSNTPSLLPRSTRRLQMRQSMATMGRTRCSRWAAWRAEATCLLRWARDRESAAGWARSLAWAMVCR